MHSPVLLQEVISNLAIKKNNLYIDATFGEGGYALEILKKGGKVLGVEWDEQQYQRLRVKYHKELSGKENLILVNENFKNIEKIAKKNNFFPVDGIIFDLGLSMSQIKSSQRGFSFKKGEEELDMRISRKIKIKANDLLNSLSEKQLYEIFSKNSEEARALSIAKAIVKARSNKKIKLVKDLIAIIDRTLGKKEEGVYRRIFQSLRIAVNDEFNNIKKGLEGSFNLLKKPGRLIVVSFHSLEDRIVKKIAKEKKLKMITKKPIISKRNLSFEKSAKLRVIYFN